MAFASHCAAPSSQLILGLHLQRSISTPKSSISTITFAPNLCPISSKSRSNAAVRLQTRQKFTLFALDPSSGNFAGKRSDRSDNAPQGPPLLTILAGVAVFFLVFWLTRSIITGLIAFIVSMIPFK